LLLLFGPRYYYEGLFSLTIASAAGIAWLAGWPTRPGEPWHTYSGWKKARPLGMTALLAFLVSANLLFYTPMRVGGMHGLYQISRARLEPFETPKAQALAPALFIVHPGVWMEYGALLELQDPFLDTPFIFVISVGPSRDAELARLFPDRHIYHYYPDSRINSPFPVCPRSQYPRQRRQRQDDQRQYQVKYSSRFSGCKLDLGNRRRHWVWRPQTRPAVSAESQVM
jgi:hypothetical protein